MLDMRSDPVFRNQVLLNNAHYNTRMSEFGRLSALPDPSAIDVQIETKGKSPSVKGHYPLGLLISQIIGVCQPHAYPS